MVRGRVREGGGRTAPPANRINFNFRATPLFRETTITHRSESERTGIVMVIVTGWLIGRAIVK
jgi:hypothetical protein